MAGTWNFTILQGETFDVTLTWKSGSPLAPVNLTGYTAHLQVRSTTADQGGPVLLDVSSGAGSIVLGGAAGTIEIVISSTATAALTFGTASYDLKVTSGAGKVTRLVQGQVTVVPEVTV